MRKYQQIIFKMEKNLLLLPKWSVLSLLLFSAFCSTTYVIRAVHITFVWETTNNTAGRVAAGMWKGRRKVNVVS